MNSEKKARQRPGEHEKTFAESVSWNGDCLVWSGGMWRNGYGWLSVNGTVYSAHRYAWLRAGNVLDEGVEIDHICSNRACVNVNHLRAVTRAENQQNRKGAPANSTSGVRGVSYHKKKKFWRSVVTVDGVMHERTSKTKEEAAEIVQAMRRELMPFSKEAQGNDR